MSFEMFVTLKVTTPAGALSGVVFMPMVAWDMSRPGVPYARVVAIGTPGLSHSSIWTTVAAEALLADRAKARPATTAPQRLLIGIARVLPIYCSIANQLE